MSLDTQVLFDLPIDVAEFEEKLGIGAESGDYRIIEKVLPYADEVHEHTSVYQLNELDFMYRQLSSDMQEEYVSLLTVFENLEALYICRNVIIVYPDCKSMIDVARQPKLILADEPTGALDSKASRLLLETMSEINKKMQATILMVTHDPFSASFCERILFLKDGKIFNEIFRGEKSRKDFFNEILDILTLLGGEVGNVR